MHEPFFNRKIRVYSVGLPPAWTALLSLIIVYPWRVSPPLGIQALADAQKRVLFKTSDLSSHLKCSNNMVAMYLSRRKQLKNSGIFQATGFNCKKESR